MDNLEAITAAGSDAAEMVEAMGEADATASVREQKSSRSRRKSARTLTDDKSVGPDDMFPIASISPTVLSDISSIETPDVHLDAVPDVSAVEEPVSPTDATADEPPIEMPNAVPNALPDVQSDAAQIEESEKSRRRKSHKGKTSDATPSVVIPTAEEDMSAPVVTGAIETEKAKGTKSESEPEVDTAIVSAALAELDDLDGRGLVIDVKRGFAYQKLFDGARSEKSYTRLLREARRGVSVRQAHYLRAVSTRFGAEVDRWVAVGATHTHLRNILNCPDDVVEELYDEMAGGTKLTVRDLLERAKPFTKEPERKVPELGAIGGLVAMKAMARHAAETNAVDFVANVRAVIEVLERNLKHKLDGRPKISKGRTITEITVPAGSAARLFEQTFCGFWAYREFDGEKYYRRYSAFGNRMVLLRSYLNQLLAPKEWAENAGDWIEGSVLPVLHWAVGDLDEGDVPFDELIASAWHGWVNHVDYLAPSAKELETRDVDWQRFREPAPTGLGITPVA